MQGFFSDLKGWKIGALAVPVLLSIVLLFPQFRWNSILFLYMPTMSGLYLDLEWLLDDARQAYLQFEYWAFPSLFEDGSPLGEIAKEDYSWEKLLEVSNNLRRPVVVRGLYNDSKAIREFGSDQWLATYNGFKIQTVAKSIGDPFKYGYELEERDFDEFMSSLKSGTFEYGYGLDEVYTKYPNLVDDLELERFGRQSPRNDWNFCQSLALFIGSTGVGLRWHNADHANMAVMLQGTKTFHMIDPKYSMFMGPDGNGDPYSSGFAARSPEHIITQLPEYTFDVNAGDAVYTPTWWWHAVETYADEDTKMAMLNTCRFSTVFQALKNQPVLELFRHQGFINWLHPKVPIMARFVPYFRVLQDGFREMFELLPAWNSNDCYSSKKKACEAYFKSVGWL